MCTQAASKIKSLFAEANGSALYNFCKSNNAAWLQQAREYWDGKFAELHSFLDYGFEKKFTTQTISCLWEMTMASFFQKHLVQHATKKCPSANPDFLININGKKYYVECVSTTAGQEDNYPYLNTELPKGFAISRDASVGVAEYKQRLISAFREKAVCKFDPTLCDIEGHADKHKSGYRGYIGNNGFIVAISSADIMVFNKPNNFLDDLACFFSSRIDEAVTFGLEPTVKAQLSTVYHEHPPTPFKISGGKDIDLVVNWFLDPAYGHVSAVIISNCWQIFYPDMDLHEPYSCNWSSHCKNDFLLIHNPFAQFPLPIGAFPVYRECVFDLNRVLTTVN